MATKDSLDDVAARWVVRIDRGSLTEQEKDDLETWLQTDIRHKGAFLRSQAVWHATDRAKALYSPTLNLPQHKQRPSRRAFMSAAAAASVAAFFIPAESGEASTRYSTQKNILHCENGKQRRIVLDCYSQLEDKSEQTSLLMGQCFITDRHRYVKTQNLRFVLDGSLLLTKSSSYENAVVVDGTAIMHGHRLNEHKHFSVGAQVTVTPQGRLHFSTVDQDTLARLTAWTQGQVSLATETLSEAADIFNRYNQKQLVPSFRLADMRLSGLFDLNRPDVFAQAVKAILGAHIKEDAGHIFLE
ncbi:DUF4880 domain-containing protein [Acetobacter cerevisiae]|uniref:DUF4880 domain-containing protein n=1 Tax=Acetobacter cerevisiae TaxID=178900 RepID=A0A149UQA9_9PROT|nr:DUF4880 domain-containing protein [Acetobacter cerevisiae]KXV70098.1 hypothetical protein AD952_13745 [Acetobacter cerevisiae]MCP1246395.1 DUF4880 domain-containing protein [Acetobacter cerevisiae]MCP1255935.1 DUF4880 domain-containing protein [Acetobacter cerevisiae]